MGFAPIDFLFGRKPKVPQLPKVSPTKVQEETLAGNIEAIPGSERIAAEFNRFNQTELQKALEFALPGGLSTIQKNISQQLAGELSPEDTRAVISSATAAGYGRGLGSSFGSPLGIGRNLVLKDLGLSVQQQKETGLSNFLKLAGATKGPQFDFTSMFLTPSQRLNVAQTQAEDQFNRDWLEAQIRAAPQPAGAFTQQLILTLAGSAGKALGAAI